MIFEKEIAPAAAVEAGGNATLIYVLGGNQESLAVRFEKAAGLYHRGVARKIHILSRPGITEFSPELGRNLTNDEWSALELEKLKVKRGDVVPVPLSDPSFFGTMNEARRVSEMIRGKGYKRLVLVSSLHHTRRCFDSFSGLLSKIPVEIYIYGANGPAGFMDLVSENIKLLVYDYIILPIHVM